MRWPRTAGRATAVVVLAAAVLAAISYVTTWRRIMYEEPAGEWEILVRAKDGSAIADAQLAIDGGVLFDNSRGVGSVVSDAEGVMTLVRNHPGPRYECETWRLFWMFSMGESPLDADLWVFSPGRRGAHVSFSQLLESGGKAVVVLSEKDE